MVLFLSVCLFDHLCGLLFVLFQLNLSVCLWLRLRLPFLLVLDEVGYLRVKLFVLLRWHSLFRTAYQHYQRLPSAWVEVIVVLLEDYGGLTLDLTVLHLCHLNAVALVDAWERLWLFSLLGIRVLGRNAATLLVEDVCVVQVCHRLDVAVATPGLLVVYLLLMLLFIFHLVVILVLWSINIVVRL